MSAQERPAANRFQVRRNILAGLAAVAAAALLLWKAVVGPSASARSDAAGVAIFDPDLLALYFWIGIGSALGGIGRFWCSGIAARLIGESFPWGTIAINVVGSFVIGFFATLTGPDGRILVSSTARQFVMVGICGGFTTFSSFSLQTLNLVNGGEWLRAGSNIGGSVVLCLVAVWAGHAAAAVINAVR